MKKLTALACTAVLISQFFLSCKGKEHKGGITGKIENSNNTYIYLVKLNQTGEEMQDSTKPLADGTFRLQFKNAEPSFYRIKLQQGLNVMMFLDSLEQPHVTMDIKSMPASVNIKGSELSNGLMGIIKELQQTEQAINGLNEQFNKNQQHPNLDSLRKALEKQYNELVEKEFITVSSFIRKNKNSPVCMALIDKISPDQHFEVWQELDEALQKTHPRHSLVINFHSRVAELLKLAVGTVAPDIVMQTPEGNTLSLSSFKGKVVLVDFWASWCRPCRSENPNVVRVYNAYHPKGFEVFSVSLDNNKDNWMKAIKEDNLIWPNHVSDLGYWQSSVVKQYNISGIPFTCLLDREGKIVAKGLRGAELEEKIATLLAK